MEHIFPLSVSESLAGHLRLLNPESWEEGALSLAPPQKSVSGISPEAAVSSASGSTQKKGEMGEK